MGIPVVSTVSLLHLHDSECPVLLEGEGWWGHQTQLSQSKGLQPRQAPPSGNSWANKDLGKPRYPSPTFIHSLILHSFIHPSFRRLSGFALCQAWGHQEERCTPLSIPPQKRPLHGAPRLCSQGACPPRVIFRRRSREAKGSERAAERLGGGENLQPSSCRPRGRPGWAQQGPKGAPEDGNSGRSLLSAHGRPKWETEIANRKAPRRPCCWWPSVPRVDQGPSRISHSDHPGPRACHLRQLQCGKSSQRHSWEPQV